MKKVVFLSLLSLVAFAADEKPDFPGFGLPFSVQQQAVNRHSKAPGRPAAALAAPMPKTEENDGHWTHCVATQTGGTHTLHLSKEASYRNNKAKWNVYLAERKSGPDGDSYEQVKDAVVKIEREDLFDSQVKNQGGLWPHQVEVVTTTVRATVSSRSTVLGEEFQGCIPNHVKKVEITTVCFDTHTLTPQPELP
jgi:hypothetical protein